MRVRACIRETACMCACECVCEYVYESDREEKERVRAREMELCVNQDRVLGVDESFLNLIIIWLRWC